MDLNQPRAGQITPAVEAVAFLQQLIRLNSVNPPGNEAEVARYIARRFENKPRFKVEIVEVAPGRANLEILLKAKNPSAARLVLTGHLDTVSPGEPSNWEHDPFGAEIVDGRLYGRGSTDMKAGVAAMLLALEALEREETPLQADVVFLGTAGEEVDSAGARHFFNRGGMDGVGAVIVGEPTNGDLGPAHKGALWLRLKTFGRTAHGSTPELGSNAITAMMGLVEQLEEELDLSAPSHPMLKPPTLALTTFSGGIQTNVIPDRATATLDIRTVPGLSHGQILKRVEQVIEKLTGRKRDFKAEVEVLNDRPPVSTPPEDKLFKLAQKVYGEVTGREAVMRAPNYYTDASALSVEGKVPTLIFGPGDDRLAHQPNEFVPVSQYLESITVFYNLVKHYGQETFQV